MKAPTAKDLRISNEDLYRLIKGLGGDQAPEVINHHSTWPLHLKNVTLLNMEEVRKMSTASTRSKEFLESVQKFMDPAFFSGYRLSRTIKTSQLSDEDIRRSVDMGKFEPCGENWKVLPTDVHGVNVFTVCELKLRRRLITEPHLNSTIAPDDLPRISYPTRLARRQSLRYARYMLQIDFEAFYDSIPLPTAMRDMFVFRSRRGDYYRLRTLPTGAKWSVAVGQGITWTIVDIETPVVIHTMIDNILIAAREDQRDEFVSAVRRILERVRRANLLTSPERESLRRMSDDELCELASGPNVFIGEEYWWNGGERLVRNSVKTVAKITLALRAQMFSCRSFVSVISLIMYAMHTTEMNPASAFRLLRAYRGVYRRVSRGVDWDSEVPYVDPTVHETMLSIGEQLVRNDWSCIAEERHITYRCEDYDYVIYTDASCSGWGALVQRQSDGFLTVVQQQWMDETYVKGTYDDPHQRTTPEFLFIARHSAHAEPRAVLSLLRFMERVGLADGCRIALVTDHKPIVQAQRRLNGFGGIGRGYVLNRLYEYVGDLRWSRGIDVAFFYVEGGLNPADHASRNFGVCGKPGEVVVLSQGFLETVPSLRQTFCPLAEEA